MEYGLIGEKLVHSYSVNIHSCFGSYGYRLIPLPKEELKSFILSKNYKGLNVTIPYKRDVIALLDFVSDKAKKIGAVNTIVNDNGILKGYNTDYFGFDYLAKSAGIDFKGKKVLVLGSGGTSQTAQAVIRDSGCFSLDVVSRGGIVNYENVYELFKTEIIVNTTPLGTFPDFDGKAVELNRFPNLCGVIDVVYNPSRTSLLFDAEKLGVKHIGGLAMLVAQGAAASELFTGTHIEDAQIKHAIQALKSNFINIVLIGMPGSGKSTVARLLAKMLNKQIIDTDEKVVEKVGKPIAEIFRDDGEEFFRNKEKECVKSIENEKGKIISTGGGIILNEENIKSLKRNGCLVFLDRKVELLETKGRPLSQSKGVKKIYDERYSIYSAYADMRIDNNDAITETVNKIIEKLNNEVFI